MTDATRTLVEQHLGEASDAHYAVLMSPPAARPALACGFALYRTLRDVLAVQPDVLPTKITWWHEELTRLKAQTPVHPLCQTLLEHRGNADIDAVHDALNALLHGAVMDANAVDVTDENLDDYLRRRAGALHEYFGLVLNVPGDPATLTAVARVHGIQDLVAESRDPNYADRANAQLALDNAGDEASLLAALTTRYASALLELDAQGPDTVTSAVYVALLRARWPQVLETPAGQRMPDTAAWRKLLTAWRAARRAGRRRP